MTEQLEFVWFDNNRESQDPGPHQGERIGVSTVFVCSNGVAFPTERKDND